MASDQLTKKDIEGFADIAMQLDGYKPQHDARTAYEAAVFQMESSGYRATYKRRAILRAYLEAIQAAKPATFLRAA